MLIQTYQRSGLVIKIPARTKAPQLEAIEHELMKTVEQLQDRRRIIGAPLTIDEMLDPSVENINEGTVYNDDDAIVAEIKHRQAIRSGEIVEVESDDEDTGDDKLKLSTMELIGLFEQLEAACIARVNADSSFDIIHKLRRFRGVLRREEVQNAKQATLDTFWNIESTRYTCQ